MSTVIHLQNVGLCLPSARADMPALSGVTLRITAGERVALVGANGSGKSSLLRVMNGLLAPSNGAVQRDTSLRQAMLFQRPVLLRFSVLHNVALALWLGGSPWRAARVQALAALGEAELAELAGQGGRQLSVGQTQRVALARALAQQPAVLLLDEPTASLDPHSKRQVEAMMQRFGARPSTTLVFASHNLGQVKRLATRVLYLEQGRVLADLPTPEFFQSERLRAQSVAADLFVKGELL